MAKTSYRPPLPAPAFIRLLAGFADGKVPAASPDLSDRLSQWVDWNRAVALSRALDGRLPPPVAEATPFEAADAAEVARVRAALVDAIAQPLPPLSASTASDDFAPLRQRVLTLQRSMLAATGRLRGRLRDMLGHAAPELARLAEVDAVMEQTLSPREQALLASVPALLGQHFARLHAAALPAAADGEPVPTAPASNAWRLRFQHDMQQVLLAELDVRFHPIEGLLAVLRPR
ncbi:DUF3348 domain-containing protein [Stenotrophomonas rhizophila]|uniref:DUF3348 domain-containing protein n=1 Tax=Stenotrophomonas rhizophila TaxID=216778 RepID=UPI001E45A89F|nr:DUF3348 domain-containing protein [Stenotrophomonas rhizophila]MCC7633961.1 DUF3348 domain-containing protein [Stenotrophomonas rhizophila]MCC7663295.1 DUF3348 domain-containing protein [Stenotrophomonas rhizophila]